MIVAANKGVAATLVDQPARSEEAVAELARSTREALTAHAVTLHGTAAGNAALWAGARIAVRGVADTVDGGYVVTSVTHVLDGAGYRSTFTTEPPEPPTAPAAASVTLGVVTAVDDPDSLGRVRVRLPALGDLDAGWLGVLCPGAGPAKGLVALPDVDDTVLVALPRQSPPTGWCSAACSAPSPRPTPGSTATRYAAGRCGPRPASRSSSTTTDTACAWRTGPAATSS
ncbi:phage baseplate assembly protein V [Luedemannella flava]